jgi:hypothetical protein
MRSIQTDFSGEQSMIAAIRLALCKELKRVMNGPTIFDWQM